LGAGESEKIIASIYFIVSKYIIRSEEEDLKDFVTIDAENAIQDCFNILLKNMSRDLRSEPEENHQKLELSVSCVNFLRAL
jgi:hypothetical protein